MSMQSSRDPFLQPRMRKPFCGCAHVTDDAWRHTEVPSLGQKFSYIVGILLAEWVRKNCGKIAEKIRNECGMGLV
ncbi:hypothetical protein G5I_02190 [Acromyrmex echinatior]|uniref:Uncharacterized protein n=1 Tax=Acromyrmex echinatior TaxID=103372 RepID=F4W9N6_ACREC|nr:hypothetical protein G5I_02190 [Acromyrmex echinatior]